MKRESAIRSVPKVFRPPKRPRQQRPHRDQHRASAPARACGRRARGEAEATLRPHETSLGYPRRGVTRLSRSAAQACKRGRSAEKYPQTLKWNVTCRATGTRQARASKDSATRQPGVKKTGFA